MSEDTRRVLEMLSQGKVTVDEADRLLGALGAPGAEAPAAKGDASEKPAPKFFRITVNQEATNGRKAETVNVRVPISVVRGGLRLGSFVPGLLGNKAKVHLGEGTDFDLSKLDFNQLDAMMKDLGELTIDVDGGTSQVRVRCE